MKGRYERAKPQKPKKRGGRIALILVLAVVLVLVAALGCGWIYYNNILNKMNKAEVVQQDPADDLSHLIATMEPEETTEANTEPTETTVPETKPMTADDIVNILVVGQSARKGEEGRMADSTMLVTINKYTKTVNLTSVLRDAFVKYPVYKGGKEGRCKVASAYAVAYSKWGVGGAMEVMNLMMEQNFGVEVDYNFEIDMEMFIKVIDAMEGVELELNQAEVNYLIKDLDGYGEPEVGMNTLDGYMALSYARMRKAEGDNESDIIRTSRQRYLVERIVNKLKYILDTKGLGAIKDLVTENLPYVTTNMENSQITMLLAELIPILPKLKIDFEQGVCPAKSKGEMFDIYGDGQLHSILRFDIAENSKIMRAITEGEIAE